MGQCNKNNTDEIWVFGDTRDRRLFAKSLSLLSKAVKLGRQINGKTAVVMFAFAKAPIGTQTAEDGCVLNTAFEKEAFIHGADKVCFLENDHFAAPSPHGFAPPLADFAKEKKPRIVLFPMTDFSRELAARTAAINETGLLADCIEIKVNNNRLFSGVSPAWGGEIMSELAFADGLKTGFATVQSHGTPDPTAMETKGLVEHIPVQVEAQNRLTLIESFVEPITEDRLEDAKTIVVGGAGLANAEGFGLVRALAAASGGQVGATRPPVLLHWVEEDRLIGQTGKSVRPNLLFSIGTSGAVQYTAGIMGSKTIVAINKDPGASIFKIADIGIVADARTFLPILNERVRQAVMRKLADALCEKERIETSEDGFGDKIKSMRKARNWSVEKLAASTGQTPEFIHQVENDEIAPPVSFLVRLAGAIGIDPGTFLKSDEKARILNRRTDAYVKRTKNYSYQTLTSGSENDHLRAFMVTIKPHHAHKPVAYKHEGEEFIFVMDGKLEFTLGSKVYVLTKGESIHFNSDIPHKLKSLSSDKTQCLVMLNTL